MNNHLILLRVDDSLETREGDEDPLDKIGAGDQGLMFGFAIDETPELMPLPIMLSHHLMQKTAQVRKSGELRYLRPDAKAEVTVEYDDNEKPVRVDTVVLSTQHDPNVLLETIREDVIEHIIKPVIPAELLDDNTKYFINPTGRFVIGGPQGDAGLTGRKIILLRWFIVMVAVLSPEKTQLKLTVQLVMRLVTLRKTL